MDTPVRLFVGNLPDKVNEKDLKSTFTNFGIVKHLDIKPKVDSTKKAFAFITLLAKNLDVESCLQHFANSDYKGNKLYVTRARESFLERLQREREQAQKAKEKELKEAVPTIKKNSSANAKKRKNDDITSHEKDREKKTARKSGRSSVEGPKSPVRHGNAKKLDSDNKRLESLKKKRQEYKEKKDIISTGLLGIDKAKNKKTIFSDEETDDHNKTADSSEGKNNSSKPRIPAEKKKELFDENDDDDDNTNFTIKKQFEGKKGQKVLDLQSRYKSDKRFTLDERFVDDEEEETKANEVDGQDIEEEHINLTQKDEKEKQLNILQDVLGVAIKSSHNVDNKPKSKLGMLRFDPAQPDHNKFLAPVENKPDPAKQSKKRKPEEETESKEPSKVEVSKEQFYKISDTLKETISKPTSFSFRSLFGHTDNDEKKKDDSAEQEYIPLEIPKNAKKVKNPLDPGTRNPFVYDSSESEGEDDKGVEEPQKSLKGEKDTKAVWKENLFFSAFDDRLKEGLLFFNKPAVNEVSKERRELKSLMKKRLYNNERKNQMFQKKIGGKKRTMKKTFKKWK